MYDVIRNFGVDYIYFDLIFLAVFITTLIILKKKLPLWAFFVGGLAINFLIDWGLWLHNGLRTVSLPFHFAGSIILFFIWFSLSYGIEYAYVFLMFQEKSIKTKIKWTAFIFIGWLLVAFSSQSINLNNAQITTVRHMADFRILEIGILVIGYLILFLLKYNWKQIGFLFLIGFLIHFMMEFSLLVSGIRPGSMLVLIENSLIEFNMGVPFFYLFWDKILRRKIGNN